MKRTTFKTMGLSDSKPNADEAESHEEESHEEGINNTEEHETRRTRSKSIQNVSSASAKPAERQTLTRTRTRNRQDVSPADTGKGKQEARVPEESSKKRKLSSSSFVAGGSGIIVTQCGQCPGKDETIASLKKAIETRVSKEVYNEMKVKYQEEKNAKDEALRRLSAMASSMLRDNNPNITNLSDQNRPTKIAEKMSELYDNQWTDAFDALEDQKMEEKAIIKFLLEILMRSYQECRAIATENYFEQVQCSIKLPLELETLFITASELPDELKQQIKEFRKSRALHVVKEVEEAIKHKLQTPYDRLPAIRTYISYCVEVSWLIAVQDPPLVLNATFSSKFDSNMFKDYTRRGPFLEYVVWPALLLHEGGALLAKGVAQGCDDHPVEKQIDE